MNRSPQKNDKGSSDSKDEDEGNKGHNVVTEERASSSSVVTEKSNNGSPSGKDEQDPTSSPLERMNKIPPLQISVVKALHTSAEQCRKGSPQWVLGQLQERQHALSHSPLGSPGRVNPLGSPREDPEEEVMQVDAQGNSLTIPLYLAG